MTPPKTFVIAEAGVNHNGSVDMARRLVDVAAAAGADAVKFQTFKAERLISRSAPKADYQKKTTDAAESQFDMLRRLELDATAHHALTAHARAAGIAFLSTPFDVESIDFLVTEIGVQQIKIPSGEITNGPLLLEAARSGRPVILSTGMSTLDDVELALGALAFGYAGWTGPSAVKFRQALAEQRTTLEGRVTLLHCTSEYPAAYDEINLRTMEMLRSRFGLPVGLSDHSVGISVPIAAVALGATVIEKHFTLDRNLPGPDHKASLEPPELNEMVRAIRQIEVALGNGQKTPTAVETRNATVARKSLVAARSLKRGERLSAEDVAVKRAGQGISPMRYWEWVGTVAKRDYVEDELLD
jgi:N-acetylneuraminate synthase